MSKILTSGLSLALFLALLIGCSNSKTTKATKANLNRETAAKEIASDFQTEQSELLVDVGKVGLHCADLNMEGEKQELPIDPETTISEVTAQKAGYIKVERQGRGFWNVTLTDRGKAALEKQPKDPLDKFGKPDKPNTLNGCNFNQVAFVIAQPSLISITDVTEENEPEVEYLFKWQTTELGDALRVDGSAYKQLDPLQRAELRVAIFSNINRVPIPVPPPDRSETGSTKFKRYDDGWQSE